ncbi:LysR family transcriptional regulator [Sporosarcina sp. YIM B06819]|uniref:LysR family transcriptional regulator n=1 Tax=Sporosarcina sp. YIM B06819 TaxID=3081769 RepID=UPI00298CD3C9|nr:LysR family transcriptional regulator [Sporosarcina sp. YIM B06819]
MNIRNLEAFVYIVHFDNFNKAAEALFLSQPTISARIRSLENEMNTKLFVREGRKSILTDSGKKLFPYAEKMLSYYQEATYKIKQDMYIPDQIRIGCANSVSSYLIPEILPELKKKFPLLRVKIISHHSEEIMNKLVNNEIDFGLIRTMTHPKIHTKTILSNPVGLFAATNHNLANKETTVSLEELTSEDIIFYDHNSTEWLYINRLMESMNLQLNTIIEVDNMESAKRLVKKGMGICFLPQHAVFEEVESNQLVNIPLTKPLNINTEIAIAYSKDKTFTDIINFCSSFVFHQFQGNPLF